MVVYLRNSKKETKQNTCAMGQDTHCALLRICRHGSQSLIPWQVSGIKDFKRLESKRNKIVKMNKSPFVFSHFLKLKIINRYIDNLFDFDAFFPN